MEIVFRFQQIQLDCFLLIDSIRRLIEQILRRLELLSQKAVLFDDRIARLRHCLTAPGDQIVPLPQQRVLLFE